MSGSSPLTFLKKAWLPVLIVVVLVIAGMTVSRVRTFFGADGVTVTRSEDLRGAPRSSVDDFAEIRNPPRYSVDLRRSEDRYEHTRLAR